MNNVLSITVNISKNQTGIRIATPHHIDNGGFSFGAEYCRANPDKVAVLVSDYIIKLLPAINLPFSLSQIT